MNDKNWFSKQSKMTKLIIAVIGICCIGLITLFAIWSILPDSWVPGSFSESKVYENEYLSFKYPKSFVDSTFFAKDLSEEHYLFFSLLEDAEPERNGMFLYAEELDRLSASTYLDRFYENLNTSERIDVKNFTLEKTDLNGISAIKATNEFYDDGHSAKYMIYLLFTHNNKSYVISFCSDSLESAEYMYELAKSSIILK